MIYTVPISRRLISRQTCVFKKTLRSIFFGVLLCLGLFGLYSSLKVSASPVDLQMVDLTPPQLDVLKIVDSAHFELEAPRTSAISFPVMLAEVQIPAHLSMASPVGFKYEVDVKRGDTLLSVLLDSGIDKKAAMEGVKNVQQTFNPKDLKVGDSLELIFKPASYSEDSYEAEKRELAALLIERRDQRKTIASWELNSTYFWNDPEPYNADIDDVTLPGAANSLGPVILSAQINSSFIESAYRAGMSHRHAQNVVDLLRYSLDFERDIQKGATFTVMYERHKNDDGQIVDGELQYVSLVNRKKRIELFRSELPDGRFGYFDADGQTNKRYLMKTPVIGARVSSSFGMRHHPVLGYSKMHKGVDFAAPTGTPIVAAGDGEVDKISKGGTYGNYIRIRHKNGYKTAYAHMQKFAKGMQTGTRVNQGDVIGYVGSTGRSTGPHLHFEVLHNDKHVNPINMKDFGSGSLTGRALTEFRNTRDYITSVISSNVRVSSNN
jgi:murein DD-endopeptidase MepM/ murein hydrolase activator NlpD